LPHRLADSVDCTGNDRSFGTTGADTAPGKVVAVLNSISTGSSSDISDRPQLAAHILRILVITQADEPRMAAVVAFGDCLLRELLSAWTSAGNNGAKSRSLPDVSQTRRPVLNARAI
jgi:hypothetical protein